MTLPVLTVGIVVYQSDPNRLRATLASLARAAAALGSAVVRLVVIDNGAREAPLGVIPLEEAEHAVFCSVERIDAGVNLGYGQGHNAVLDGGCGEFHLVLNPDVEMAPDALQQGIAWLRAHPDASGVVPDGRDEAGVPVYLAKADPGVLVLLLRAFAPPALRRAFADRLAAYELHALCARGEPVSVPLASGCFMLLRGEAFRSAGGFDPRFFLYFEDFDLSRRLVTQGPLIYLPTMRIVHHGGNAARKGWRHWALFARSALRYFSRWGWRLC